MNIVIAGTASFAHHSFVQGLASPPPFRILLLGTGLYQAEYEFFYPPVLQPLAAPSLVPSAVPTNRVELNGNGRGLRRGSASNVEVS